MFKRFMVSLGLAASLVLGGLSVPTFAHAAPAVSDTITPPPIPDLTKVKQTTLKGFKDIKAAPPTKDAARSGTQRLLTGPYYYYNRASQGTGGFGTLPTGLYGTLGWGAASPSFNGTRDYHTIMQLSVEDTNAQGRQIVEFGARQAGSGMKIFTSHWVNGVGGGYNTGFNVVGTPLYAPGTAVGPGTALTANVKLWIEYTGGHWWFGAHPTGGSFQWVGYYNSNLWTGASPATTFVNADFPQAFGEIASQEAVWSDVCSSMGSNTLATSGAGAFWSSLTFPNLSSTLVSMTWGEVPAGIHTYWNAEALSGRSGRVGGPGDGTC